MPRRTRAAGSRSAELRPEQMRAALPRLRKRIEELRSIDIDEIQDRADPHLDAIEKKVNSTLSDILGHDTVEYREFGSIRLDRASINLLYETPIGEVREGFARGIGSAISSIEAMVILWRRSSTVMLRT